MIEYLAKVHTLFHDYIKLLFLVFIPFQELKQRSKFIILLAYMDFMTTVNISMIRFWNSQLCLIYFHLLHHFGV